VTKQPRVYKPRVVGGKVMITRQLAPKFYRALREEPFAYHGMLLGRELQSQMHAA
jgi:hypothetical protein